MADLTNKWYQAIRHSPEHSHTDDEDEEISTKIPSSSTSIRINPKT